MTVRNRGSLRRTPEDSGCRQEHRASTSTSGSTRNRESPQMHCEAFYKAADGGQMHEAFTVPCEAARAASASLPPAKGPDGYKLPAQGTALTQPKNITTINPSGSGELLAGPLRECCKGDLKQRLGEQAQQDQQQQQEHPQKQMQRKQQQEMLLPHAAMTLGEHSIEDFWPPNLVRRPSVEMLQHLRVAAERHQDPIAAFIPPTLNPATPAKAVAELKTVPAEVARAEEVVEKATSTITSHNISTKTIDGVVDSKANNSESWIGRPHKLPMNSDIPYALAGVSQPRGDCSFGPSDVVSTGKPVMTASSSTATIAGAAPRAEVCTTVNINIAKKAGAQTSLVDTVCESLAKRRINGRSNCNDTGNMQKLRCDILPCGEPSSELKNARGPHRQLCKSSTLDGLVQSNRGFSAHGSIYLGEQRAHEDKQPQHPLQQQPQTQAGVLQNEKKHQSQQRPHEQTKMPRPREFVRQLALGLLTGHRGGGKNRRAWLSRCYSSSSRISRTQQQERQRIQQRPQDDGGDWEACCLLQPADEKNDGLPAHNRSNSSTVPRFGGCRRASNRLQRMAFSFGCFGEASQRRTGSQRDPFGSLTPAQYRAWRKQQQAYADDGSLFPRGLANLKNTCFLNAALQALAGIPSFVASLQAGLPPEPGVREVRWHGTYRAFIAHHDENNEATSGIAGAACSSTTATPDSEDTRGQRLQQLRHVEHQSEQQMELLKKQQLRRQELLLRLRLQQERREKHQPECLGSLDENQRRLLLREFFTLLCRLTCCPSIRSYGSAEETSREEFAAQRPRESNSAATCRPEPQQQWQQRKQQHTPAVKYDTIRPERLRRALVAPLAGLLLNDCNMQQQQDCHEFLRGLIDLIHEILKTCRWEREEAAAAQQLLQLQATSPMADLEPVFLTSFGSLRFPLTLDEDKQTQHQKSPPKVQLSENRESSEPGKAVGCDGGDVERAEKKWREYIRDQASPMADFFAGQLCSEIQCAGCRQSLFIYEPAWDLSLPLPVDGKTVSLSNLLEGFFGSEELDFSCSSCHSPACKAYRTIRYTHTPKVLLLQIKRFSASGQKRRTRVEYPLEELVIKTKSESATFRLIAVIEHNGNSCQSGHYVAYVRRRRFVIPVAIAPATTDTASGRNETPRNSACSPSEFLRRIGILKGLTSCSAHSLRHPHKSSTAPPSGPSPRQPPLKSPFRPPRPAISFDGMADDGTEWFRFDDGLVLPVSEADVFSAEAYCLFYSRTNNTERQCISRPKQESPVWSKFERSWA